MLRAILNKSWQQHPTRHQQHGHLPSITKTIQARRTRHARHCWRSKDELVSDVLQWTPAYGQSKAGRPAGTYIQQLCDDTGCNPKDMPEAMNDRETWRERGSGISVLAARHDDDDISKRTLFSSIWPIDNTLSGATTPGQSGTGSKGNEEAVCIPEAVGLCTVYVSGLLGVVVNFSAMPLF